MWKYKKIVCLGIAIVASALATMGIYRGELVNEKVQETQEELAQSVFRFHVRANSDTEIDQNLKLEVRDGIILYMKKNMDEAGEAKETKEWARNHLHELENEAEEIMIKKGYAYQAKAKVGVEMFPEKTYGDLTFPAGEYESLSIELGKGEGQNWWCVLYPNLCFLNSVKAVVPEEGKDMLEEELSQDAYNMVTTGTNFKIKWFFFGDGFTCNQEKECVK